MGPNLSLGRFLTGGFVLRLLELKGAGKGGLGKWKKFYMMIFLGVIVSPTKRPFSGFRVRLKSINFVLQEDEAVASQLATTD